MTNQPAPGHEGRGRPAIGKRVHFHCDPDTLARIDMAAALSGATRAAVIRRLLKTALESDAYNWYRLNRGTPERPPPAA